MTEIISLLIFYPTLLLFVISCASTIKSQTAHKEFFFKPKWFLQLYTGELFEVSPKDFASPSVSEDGNMVITGSKNGYVFAVSASSGKELWNFKTGGAVYAKPLLSNGILYVTSADGCVYALSSSNGKPNWKAPYCTGNAVLSEAVVSDSLLFFATNTNRLYAIKRETGEFVWDHKRKLPDSFTILGVATPVLSKGRVIAGFSDGTLTAIDIDDGSVAWSVNLTENKSLVFKDIDVKPVVKNGIIYTASFQGGVFAVNSENGEIVWANETSDVSGLTLCGETLYLHSSIGEMLALDFLDGETELKKRITRQLTSPFICSEHFLIAACEEGIFIADKSLNPVALLSFPYGISSQLAVSKGNIYFVSNGGYLHSFEFFY